MKTCMIKQVFQQNILTGYRWHCGLKANYILKIQWDIVYYSDYHRFVRYSAFYLYLPNLKLKPTITSNYPSMNTFVSHSEIGEICNIPETDGSKTGKVEWT